MIYKLPYFLSNFSIYTDFLVDIHNCIIDLLQQPQSTLIVRCNYLYRSDHTYKILS